MSTISNQLKTPPVDNDDNLSKITSSIVGILTSIFIVLFSAVVVLFVWNIILTKYTHWTDINIGDAINYVVIITTIKMVWNLIPSKIHK